MQSWKVGIDYSMTSPAIVIASDTKVNCYYFAKTKAQMKNFSVVDKTGRTFTFFPYEMKDFVCREERFKNLAEWAVSLIPNTVKTVNVEGYSMGSSGGKFLEIAENGGVLRHFLYTRGFEIVEIAPTSVKKFATGKGTAKKEQMHEAFINETGINLNFEFGKKGESCTSPVSDIVDAYFIMKY